ncbi:MAG: hypothetical protein CL521_03920 [Actinobacteria bacterium]|nr:hypothetical protein [Actinomycetota bacterium]
MSAKVTTGILNSKYQLTQLVSEDIISIHYLAKTLYSDVLVHVWRFKSTYLHDELVRRLIQTADQLSQLRHPHLLRLLDYHFDGKDFYVIYERRGHIQRLETYLKDKSKWEMKNLWQISTQLLSASVYLQSKGLFGGNLNLNGVYVDENEQVYIVKAMVALLIYQEIWDQVSLVDELMFYAPEFVQWKQYNIQSDIYSFGVLLYLFFSQKWPYKFQYKIDALKKEFLKGPRPFQKANDKVPDRLFNLVQGCMAQDPGSRYQSFSQLIKVYKGELDFEVPEMQADTSKVVADISSSIQLASQQRRKRWVRWGLSSFLVALLFLGCYGVYWRYLNLIPQRIVPDIVGLTQENAQLELSELGLKSMVSGVRFHPVYLEGTVIESQPVGGRDVKLNRMIRLFVSKGQKEVAVPDLVGRTKFQAEQLLVDRDLVVHDIQEAYSLEFPSGVIIAQTPTPNTLFQPDDQVSLVLSKGFPLTLNVVPLKRGFFHQKSVFRDVQISFSILPEWSTQEVTIYFEYQGQKEMLYVDTHEPGDEVSLEFELELEGEVDVYFNEELGLSQIIEEPVDDD